MPRARPQTQHRPRELRRRVVMPARLRSSAGWSDACILNVSSRGLLIHSACSGGAGSTVELRRGDHVIAARVVWRDGARAGLQTHERLIVEEILSLHGSAAMTLTAGGCMTDPPRCERRRAERRSQGRTIEFVGVVLIACSLAVMAFDMVQQALSRPIMMIASALS